MMSGDRLVEGLRLAQAWSTAMSAFRLASDTYITGCLSCPAIGAEVAVHPQVATAGSVDQVVVEVDCPHVPVRSWDMAETWIEFGR
jgi:hypothetical protein